MPNYNNGLIYMIRHICDYKLENIYIGSTTNFRQRKKQHKNCCNVPTKKDYNYPVYQYIRNNGGWDCWCMVQILPFPCNSKRELEQKEDELIRKYKSKLNKTHPTATPGNSREIILDG